MTEPMFDRHINLPSGGQVEFLDPEEMTGKHMKRVIASLRNLQEDPSTGEVLDAADGVACMLISSWTIPYAPGRPKQPTDEPWPLPNTDVTLLEQLSAPDYRKILDAVGPAVPVFFPSEARPDDANKPGSPTVPDGA